MSSNSSLLVLFENALWQQPLFERLEQRGIAFRAFDLKQAVFAPDSRPSAGVCFNQASPSAYLRGNPGAVPFALEYIEFLEARGTRVINGSRAFRFELSKTAQLRTMADLGIDFPRSWTFNDLNALRDIRPRLQFPAILKPNQGGSGARMFRTDSFEELEVLLANRPEIWDPDRLLLIQEYLQPKNPADGIVRIEILGQRFLYATRVISKGNFNLCPSEVCNPSNGSASTCDPVGGSGRPEFYPCPEVPASAVEDALRLIGAGGINVGAAEYMETADGRRVFYDVNANSNLRPAIGQAFGFDPFDKVVDYLETVLSDTEVPA